MQGIFINGKRPKSKKAIKEAVVNDPRSVTLEATSVVGGNEYDGPILAMPESNRATAFVGPDPYTSRKFYGTIKRSGTKVTVS